MNFRYLVLLLTMISPGAVSAGQLDPAPTTLRIGGSGASLATMQILGQAFKKTYPEASIFIVPSLGSGGGIKALRAGAIDLAVISRPMKDTERSPNVTATEYARTPLVFATAMRTNISAITTPELISAYNGERKTWPDGLPLRLVLRPEAESDTDIIKSLSPEMNQAVNIALGREGMIVALTDLACADSLEKIPGALGSTTLAQIISEKRSLRPLVLNGVTPSLITLAEGKYRYYKTFFMVTGPDTSPVIQQFSSFVSSPAGREILEKNGHWVAPTK